MSIRTTPFPRQRVIGSILLAAAFQFPASIATRPSAAQEAQSTEEPLEGASWWRHLDGGLLVRPVTNPLAIDIAWVTGSEPNALALNAFSETARQLCGGCKVEIRLRTAVAKDDWERAGSTEAAAAAQLAKLSAQPGGDRIFVFYVPRGRSDDPSVGGSAQYLCYRQGSDVDCLPSITVVTDVPRARAPTWARVWVAEAAGLNHELFHLLGMVANPQHADVTSQGHCTSRSCLLRSALRRVDFQLFRDELSALVPLPGLCAQCRQDIEDARRQWSRLAPGEAAALLERRRAPLAAREQARLYWIDGEKLKAIDAARRTVSATGALPDLKTLAWYLAEANESAQSICVYQEAMAAAETKEQRSELAFGLARALCRCRRYAEAERIVHDHMAAIAARYADDVTNSLTWALAGQRRLREATSLWQKTPRRERSGPVLLRVIGSVTLDRWTGRLDEAAAVVDRYNDLFSDDPVWQVQAALVRGERGDAAGLTSVSTLLATLVKKRDPTCREVDAGITAAAALGRRAELRTLAARLTTTSDCPDDEVAWLHRRALALAGDIDEAITLIPQSGGPCAASDVWHDWCAVPEFHKDWDDPRFEALCSPCEVRCAP